MQKRKYEIRPYILIPVIFAGLTVFSVVITYRFLEYGGRFHVEPLVAVMILSIALGLIAFACGLLILRFILSPVTSFIAEAERHPLVAGASSSPEAAEHAPESPVHYGRILRQVSNILGKIEAREMFPQVVGQSVAMRGLFGQLLKVAPTDTTVIIYGESGTGKELIAEAIKEQSLRRDKPFVKINCVAIPESLLESELFGYEKGAFTGALARKMGKFELAHSGTIFLDEIGDMPLETQAKLLRVLQERELERVGGSSPVKIDVRFLAATNKDLAAMVKQGQFREDLFHRLNVFALYLTPLRERKEDIPVLADHFLRQSPCPKRLSSEALVFLMTQEWPGNVRELQNTLARAMILADGEVIEPAHLTKEGSGQVELQLDQPMPIDERIAHLEKCLVMDALVKSAGIQVKAAQLLGINQRSLWHRIKKYSIDVQALKSS